MDPFSLPARSVSMPSRTQPISLQVIEESLNKLRSHNLSLSSAWGNLTTETIQFSLLGLLELYGRVEEFFLSPCNQQGPRRLEVLEEILDISAEVLDICTIARNLMLKFKDQVNFLQSALRRRGFTRLEYECSLYIGFRKSMTKQLTQCLRGLKQMESKYGLTGAEFHRPDSHLAAVLRVLREVYGVTIGVITSLLVFSSIPAIRSGWTLVSRLLIKRSNRSRKMLNEITGVDLAVIGGGKLDIPLLQEKLPALDASIHCLEDKLERLSRCLVKTRVSLLNILTH